MEMKANDYLNRIGIPTTGQILPTKENLNMIHKHHHYKVPYENLDLHMGIKTTIGVEECWEKIIIKNRGGYCCEHIQVINYALLQLGYNSRMGTGRVVLGSSADTLTPPGAHAYVVVTFGENDYYLVDVGYPDSSVESLCFSDSMLGEIQHSSDSRDFKITKEGTLYKRWSKNVHTKEWKTVHDWQWDLGSPSLDNELQIVGNDWVVNGPNSPFIKNILVTLPKEEGGRLTISGTKLITTNANYEKTNKQITQTEIIDCLLKDFGLSVPDLFEIFNEANSSPLEDFMT